MGYGFLEDMYARVYILPGYLTYQNDTLLIKKEVWD